MALLCLGSFTLEHETYGLYQIDYGHTRFRSLSTTASFFPFLADLLVVDIKLTSNTLDFVSLSTASIFPFLADVLVLDTE